jgi:hypothetical protein
MKMRKPVLEKDYASMLKSAFIQTDNDFLNEHKYVVKTCPAVCIERKKKTKKKKRREEKKKERKKTKKKEKGE